MTITGFQMHVPRSLKTLGNESNGKGKTVQPQYFFSCRQRNTNTYFQRGDITATIPSLTADRESSVCQTATRNSHNASSDERERERERVTEREREREREREEKEMAHRHEAQAQCGIDLRLDVCCR